VVQLVKKLVYRIVQAFGVVMHLMKNIIMIMMVMVLDLVILHLYVMSLFVTTPEGTLTLHKDVGSPDPKPSPSLS
jgi:hypothetical protein